MTGAFLGRAVRFKKISFVVWRMQPCIYLGFSLLSFVYKCAKRKILNMENGVDKKKGVLLRTTDDRIHCLRFGVFF